MPPEHTLSVTSFHNSQTPTSKLLEKAFKSNGEQNSGSTILLRIKNTYPYLYSIVKNNPQLLELLRLNPNLISALAKNPTRFLQKYRETIQNPPTKEIAIPKEQKGIKPQETTETKPKEQKRNITLSESAPKETVPVKRAINTELPATTKPEAKVQTSGFKIIASTIPSKNIHSLLNQLSLQKPVLETRKNPTSYNIETLALLAGISFTANKGRSISLFGKIDEKETDYENSPSATRESDQESGIGEINEAEATSKIET